VGGYIPLLNSIIPKMADVGNLEFTYLFSPSKSKYKENRKTFENTSPIMCKAYCLIFIIFLLLTLIVRLQNEKHSRIRSFMRMMGMSDSPYYISHFISFPVFSFSIAILTTVFGKALYLKRVNTIIIFIQCYLMLMSVFFFALFSK